MKNKKFWIAIIIIIALILVTFGITYAYWMVPKKQITDNTLTVSCLDISLDGEKNDIELTSQFPMSDEDGMDLTPYEFTITNKCNTSVDYHVNLESLETGSTKINSSSLKVVLNENEPKLLYDYVGTFTTIEEAYEAYRIGYGTLAAYSDTSDDDSVTYNLRIWVSDNAPITEMNKTYTGKISVNIGSEIFAQGSTLASLILEDAEENNYLYSTTPDFRVVTTAGEYGLYQAPDDFGTSYYFRGDVENNYVKFGKWSDTSNKNAGKDIYWRIIRINGDGSIRMIYDGIQAVDNGKITTATLGDKPYNTNHNESKYVGYTYDDGNGNQVDSAIKGVVDAWYEANLEAEYGKYIADSIFCNDRKVTSTSGTSQHFGAYDRVDKNKSPKLSCTQDSDKYTVSEIKGNSLLNNPVGLITADEAAMAGGVAGASSTNYLLNGGWYWTMSPRFSLNASNAYVWYVGGASLIFGANVTYPSAGVRPVINLKSDVLFIGSGTTTDPYKLAS